jgi:hypothetical protein
MSQLSDILRNAADKNHQLLSELSQTDYAPSSLQQNTSYIADLKAQIANTDKELARLHKITEDEKKVCSKTTNMEDAIRHSGNHCH